MKKTAFTSFIESIHQHRLLFWICVVSLTVIYFFSCCYQSVVPFSYKASAKLYPLVMTKCQEQTVDNCVNPCFMMKRVFASNDFQKGLTDGEHLSAHQFSFNETNDHCIEINSIAKDAETALDILNAAILHSNAIFWGYSSSRLSLEENYSESIVKDYCKLTPNYIDTCNIDDSAIKTSSAATLQGQIMCFNIIDAPHIVKEPDFAALIVALLLSFMFSLCFSALVTWIYTKSKA